MSCIQRRTHAAPPQAYLAFYPDVETDAGLPLHRAEVARQHYQHHGYKEMRVYKKPAVLLRYTTCGTTMEQHYAHIAGLTIAAALGGDVVVPPWLAPGGAAPAGLQQAQQAQPFSEVWDSEHIGR